MHDIYFALAMTQWMCCALLDDILNRVKTIINSGANPKYWCGVEADED